MKKDGTARKNGRVYALHKYATLRRRLSYRAGVPVLSPGMFLLRCTVTPRGPRNRNAGQYTALIACQEVSAWRVWEKVQPYIHADRHDALMHTNIKHTCGVFRKRVSRKEGLYFDFAAHKQTKKKESSAGYRDCTPDRGYRRYKPPPVGEAREVEKGKHRRRCIC